MRSRVNGSNALKKPERRKIEENRARTPITTNIRATLLREKDNKINKWAKAENIC